MAIPEDAPRIAALTQLAYSEYAETDAPSSVIGETPSAVRAALESGTARAVIVELDRKPVGSVRFRFDGDALYFFRLGLLPEARGRGLAQMLLAALEQIAVNAGARRIRCKVRRSVARNVRLYRNRGYAEVGEEVVQRGGSDVLLDVMEKPVGERADA
jgi:ribosomal protein S18 acetylase RimI-like enzyme